MILGYTLQEKTNSFNLENITKLKISAPRRSGTKFRIYSTTMNERSYNVTKNRNMTNCLLALVDQFKPDNLIVMALVVDVTNNADEDKTDMDKQMKISNETLINSVAKEMQKRPDLTVTTRYSAIK